MNHEEGIKRWHEYARSKGWTKLTHPAPHERLLGKMGIECPPAIFWPPWVNGVLYGTLFAIFWGVFMYFTVWEDRTFYQISLPSISCGILFGLIVAIFHWHQQRKLGLVTWKKFKS